MGIAERDQTTIDERIEDAPAIEKVLEDRQKVLDERAELNRQAKELTAKAKLLIEDLDVDTVQPVRVGRFVITKRVTEAREVSFTTEPKAQIRIKVDKDD